jgi:uncharacterized protein YeaO (DUF488 family)
MTIHHASVYDPEQPPGYRVLTMRYWPRGVRRERVDVWLRDAGPSRELVGRYSHGQMDWPAFAEAYRHEVLDERPEVLAELRRLEAEHGCLVLLCYERIPPHEHCHRELLADLLAAPAP